MQLMFLILASLLTCVVQSQNGWTLTCYTNPGGWYPVCPRSELAVQVVERAIREYHANKNHKVVAYVIRTISAQVISPEKHYALILETIECPEYDVHNSVNCLNVKYYSCWFEVNPSLSGYFELSPTCYESTKGKFQYATYH